MFVAPNHAFPGSHHGKLVTHPNILYPLTPHVYIVKLGFTGVYIFSYFCSKTDCGYSLEPPQYRLIEAVLTCTHNLCFEQKQENIIVFFILKIIIFTALKNCSILYRHVCIMNSKLFTCDSLLFFTSKANTETGSPVACKRNNI